VVDPLLFNWHITLVAGEGHYKSVLVCRRVGFHLIDPVLDRFERVLVAEVVADYRADCVTVVHIYHRTEPFVAACIPNVHLHLLLGPRGILWVWNANYFLKVRATNGDVMHLVEAVLAEAQSNGRFTHSRISE